MRRKISNFSESIKDATSFLISVVFGSFLYVILNLVPIIGPVIVGVSAVRLGKRRRTIKEGFSIGLFSGLLGFALVLFVFSDWIYSFGALGTVLVGSLVIVWNFVSILFCGVGGALGVILDSPFSVFDKLGGKRERKEGDEEKIEEVPTRLVICRSCKTANPKERKMCLSCKKKL